MMESDNSNSNPRLGDFELAKRQDYATMVTRVGLGTLEYMAPECFTSAPDKSGDIYSLGVLFLVVLCFKGKESELTVEHTQLNVSATLAKVDQDSAILPLLVSMLDPDPTARPTALEVVSLLNSSIRTCRVCGCTTANSGVHCADQHFVCRECFDHYVVSLTNQGMKEVQYVHCHMEDCPSRPFDDYELVDMLERETWGMLCASRKRLVETTERERVEELAKQAGVLAEHRNAIDTKVTSYCPHCHGAFIDGDWTACMDITCEACGGHFCGFCMYASRADLYGHIKTCANNPRPGHMIKGL